MADRQVTCTGKQQGIITSVGQRGAAWSPRAIADAIRDIDAGLHSYHVLWADGRRTEISVVNGPYVRYLRTDHDSTTRNNLDDLPDC